MLYNNSCLISDPRIPYGCCSSEYGDSSRKGRIEEVARQFERLTQTSR